MAFLVQAARGGVAVGVNAASYPHAVYKTADDIAVLLLVHDLKRTRVVVLQGLQVLPGEPMRVQEATIGPCLHKFMITSTQALIVRLKHNVPVLDLLIQSLLV